MNNERENKIDEDFCLKNKKTSWMEECNWKLSGNGDDFDVEPIEWKGVSGFYKKDVQEFIRRLKKDIYEEYSMGHSAKVRINMIINKRSGDL